MACAAMVGLALARPAVPLHRHLPTTRRSVTRLPPRSLSTSRPPTGRARRCAKYYPRGASPNRRRPRIAPVPTGLVRRSQQEGLIRPTRSWIPMATAWRARCLRPSRQFRAELLGETNADRGSWGIHRERGLPWRVGSFDGIPQAVTMDTTSTEVDLDVNDGYVTDATWG